MNTTTEEPAITLGELDELTWLLGKFIVLQDECGDAAPPDLMAMLETTRIWVDNTRNLWARNQ